ncbi:GpW/Gp25/anti-adapter protein IraD [uncultured Caudovirales phage]|uniref:GpW/Gp25/anti-adapter protein IraD n=1 Tax=uncultured Caudovirales phage TaxID=2100421 RepID=A0A6J5L6U0_9CAUD|nr:GpW/Gp25/anti-adapter protein IraD [uncultured Caudovirales phage]
MAETTLTFPFALDPNTGSIMSTSSQEVIWHNRVRMAMETRLGERVMRPTYGTEISQSVFNTITSMEETLKKETNKLFVYQFPLLELVSVKTLHDVKENRLSAEVTYRLPNNTSQTTQVGVIVVSDVNPPYEELS